MTEETIGKILYTEDEIRARAAELGKQITQDYKGEELIILGTLKGAVMWMCDLIKNINLDTKNRLYFCEQLWFRNDEHRYRQGQQRRRL